MAASKAACHRANVDAGTQQLGGDKVAEVVQPDTWHTLLVAQESERPRHGVGEPRLPRYILSSHDAPRCLMKPFI